MDIQTTLIYFIDDGILAGKSSATLKGYRYSINSLLQYTKQQFLSQDMKEVRTEVIKGFMINGIKLRKWNKFTQWTMYKNLNVFFGWAYHTNLIQNNPMVDIPRPKIPQQLPKSLNEQEVLNLLKIVANIPSQYYFYTVRNKAVIATFLYTGIRRNELLNLKFTDVDVMNGFIQIEKGKGNKRREVPIEQTVLKPILQEYIEHRTRLVKTSEWFFVGTFAGRGNNDSKLSLSAIGRLFKRLSKLMNKRIHPHKLRHSFATLLLDKTGDIYVLKELLGHNDIKTTCVYLSTTRQKKVEAIKKLSLN